MDIGMLWLDDDKQTTLEDKILRAADYYQSKYGQKPNLCLVNTAAVDADREVGMIHVQPVRNVLPNHFWLGVQATT